ncbi:MAG: hypothetical protein ACK5PF_10955 [bacterium]|jgi:transcriptional regulator with XRE-family HTH domain
MKQSLIEKVKLVMSDQGLNKTSLGRRLNISGQRVGLYLSGKRNPKRDFYDAWEKSFGWRLEEDPPKATAKPPEISQNTELMQKIISTQEEYINSLKAENARLLEHLNKKIGPADVEKIRSR